jgi:hypothetical protein
VLPTTDAGHFTRESALVKLAHRDLPAPAIAFAETVRQEAQRLGIAAQRTVSSRSENRRNIRH